jgi:hypothetical protein
MSGVSAVGSSTVPDGLGFTSANSVPPGSVAGGAGLGRHFRTPGATDRCLVEHQKHGVDIRTGLGSNRRRWLSGPCPWTLWMLSTDQGGGFCGVSTRASPGCKSDWEKRTEAVRLNPRPSPASWVS